VPAGGGPEIRPDQEPTGDVLRIEMLPAGHGDALLLEYGNPDDPHRILVDGGPATSYEQVSARIAGLGPQARRFELLVMTHVDADHVEGVLKLLNDKALDAEFGDIWFNGYRHLPKDELGPAQGEMLSAVIEERGLAWNASFGGGTVEVDQAPPLRRVELAGGLRLTLLGPGRAELVRLRRAWEREIRRAGFVPGSIRDALVMLEQRKQLTPLDSYLGAPPLDVARLASASSDLDGSVTNASSISVLAEYGERKILLTGDATPPVLTGGVRQLLQDRGLEELRLDAFKVPHHGSRNNLTSGLVRMLPSRHYLFSTDGKYFGHPDDAAVARVVVGSPAGAELVFNYRTEQSKLWDTANLQETHGYRTRFPHGQGDGIAVDL
jgi:hypothetical protein